ncbi:MAG TPA: hypothetical protein VK178_14830 [Opitutaceae bacterium]|nr:hypothetical protein [Opitutaceae bacterium]
MKTPSALLSLALGIGLATSVTIAAPKPTAKPAAQPAEQAAAGDVLDEKNLAGILITRANGGFLNLKVDGGKFVMAFYDKDKKAVAPDVTKATVRYRKFKTDQRFFLAGGADGKTLSSPLPVDRPYVFNTVHIVLFDDNEETPAETYVKNFRQFTPGDGEGTPVDEMTPEQLEKLKK